MLNTEIHPEDQMLGSSRDRYFSVGSDALRIVLSALDQGKVNPNTILDYACGCGRVLRHLRNEFPDATIVASDLMKHGVAFCAEQFGATPHIPSPNLDAVTFDREFDLIWSGSLMTHFNEARAEAMIRLFVHSLAPQPLGRKHARHQRRI